MCLMHILICKSDIAFCRIIGPLCYVHYVACMMLILICESDFVFCNLNLILCLITNVLYNLYFEF